MQKEVEQLLGEVKDEHNPLIIANKISYFISDALREHALGIYDAYLLNGEEIRFRRMSYIQPAWNGNVSISTCLALLNQKVLADFFQERAAQTLQAWSSEACRLNEEKRTHYIMNEYDVFLNAVHSPEALKKLQKVRGQYMNLNDRNGPYHTEVFPYHFYSPEKMLLDHANPSEHKSSVDTAIEELIVELNAR